MHLDIDLFDSWCESVKIQPAIEYESIHEMNQRKLRERKRANTNGFQRDKIFYLSSIKGDIKRYENKLKTLDSSDPKYKVYRDILSKYRICYNKCNGCSNIDRLREINKDTHEYVNSQLNTIKEGSYNYGQTK